MTNDGSVKLILSWFKNVGIKIGISWEKSSALLSNHNNIVSQQFCTSIILLTLIKYH